MIETSIVIPNTLKLSHQQADQVVSLTTANLNHSPLTYDLREVDFLTPYGVLLLLTTARHAAQTIGHRVRFKNMRTDIHAYLQRIDFFEQGSDWLYTEETLPSGKQYARNEASSNLLEITRLSSIGAQAKFQSRARVILRTWLQACSECNRINDWDEIDSIWTVLSEICNNAREHSGDHGHVMIQRYQHRDHIEVHIAAVDLGIGIPGSLSRQHGPIAEDSTGYILKAMKGYSARGAQQGGAGLQIVQKRLAQKGGVLAIRSDDGLVVTDGKHKVHQVAQLPGTQVSVQLRSNLASHF